MRLFRGYDPRNDEIISKAVTYAKKVVLAYYDEKGKGKPPELRAFFDTERAEIHKEMNDTQEYILDKSHVGTDIDNDTWRFIDDRVKSALIVYREYLKDESGNLVSEAFDAEFEAIENVFRNSNQEQESNYNLYLKLYEERKNDRKLHELDPDTDE